MRAIWYVLASLLLFTGLAVWSFRYAPPPIQSNPTIQAASTLSATDQTLTLVHDEPELPPGPGREVFVAQCIICHSPRYVTMQPHFPRKVWRSEVEKMVKGYKASISPGDQAQIVNYLVYAYGVEDAAH
jgi:mono/diheme cytochrome c family protein